MLSLVKSALAWQVFAGTLAGCSVGRLGHLSLHEAADLLGVHYMTIYRRVRLGILPARKIGGTWMVDPADLVRATTTPDRGRRRRGSHPRVSMWQERLQARMLSGDVAGSWQVIEAAMASGLEPGEIYVRVLAPSLHAIGALWDRWHLVDQEHLASSVATTLIGRLGPRFVHPGRKKGVVIVAMPPGERHGLGVAMLADILTDAGYEVLNLGPTRRTCRLPRQSELRDLAAVVVSVVDIERRPAAGRLLAAARRNDRRFRAWSAETRFRTNAWRSISVRTGGSRIRVGSAT